MAEVRIPAWRQALWNFTFVSFGGLALEALHKLRSLGQNVTEMVIDAIGIAALFTVIMYAVDKGRETDATDK